MVAAIIAGPILAVQVQKYLESFNESKKRKMALFETLMSTRGDKAFHTHVTALNKIDIEFYGKSVLGIRSQSNGEKKVTKAWKMYNDHLNSRDGADEYKAWALRGEPLFINLLYVMSQHLGYEFDEVQLRRDFYKPQGHVNVQTDQEIIRAGIVDVLAGRKPIPVVVTYLPPYTPIEPSTNVKSQD